MQEARATGSPDRSPCPRPAGAPKDCAVSHDYVTILERESLALVDAIDHDALIGSVIRGTSPGTAM